MQYGYHGDHAVVLFPGSTAAEERHKENQDTNCDDDNWSCWGGRVLNQEGFV